MGSIGSPVLNCRCRDNASRNKVRDPRLQLAGQAPIERVLINKASQLRMGTPDVDACPMNKLVVGVEQAERDHERTGCMASQRSIECLGNRVLGWGMRRRRKRNILRIEKIASIGHRSEGIEGAVVFQRAFTHCAGSVIASEVTVPVRRDVGGGAARKDGVYDRSWMSGKHRAATEDGIVEVRRHHERSSKSIGHGGRAKDDVAGNAKRGPGVRVCLRSDSARPENLLNA